jgi:thiamine biosynthesis lipoprotein
MTDVVESSFHAMGSEVHVIVVDGPSSLLDAARERIEQLEARWSRFRPDSEISELNARAGEPVRVSGDTVALVTRAIDAWRFTGGSFDPTVLGPMLRAGYDRSFEEISSVAVASPSVLVVACTDIEVVGNIITLPIGTGFDPGGIGKGLTADLVAEALVASGAAGVCVNMGGDVRVMGVGPDGTGWTIAVEHPWSTEPLVHVGIANGAIATSTTLKRRWTVDGVARHHLIDPATGEPSDTDLDLVTVIAGNAWAAEVLAKAVLIRGSAHPFDLVEGSGAQALVVRSDGAVVVSAGFSGFCNGVTPPAFVRPEL